MMNRPRLAVDMDEVLADSFGALRCWLHDKYGYAWSDEEVKGRKLSDLILTEHNDAMSELLSQGKIYGDFEVVADSQEVLDSLSRRYEIYITTAAMEYPNSIPFKYQWLRKYFSFLDPMNFVFCGQKNIISANFLIDDNERHLKRFGGQGIVFSAHHNANLLNYPRMDNWKTAPALLDDLASVLFNWRLDRGMRG